MCYCEVIWPALILEDNYPQQLHDATTIFEFMLLSPINRTLTDKLSKCTPILILNHPVSHTACESTLNSLVWFIMKIVLMSCKQLVCL